MFTLFSYIYCCIISIYSSCTTLTCSSFPLRIKPVLGSPVSVNIISWRSHCVIRTALLYIVGSIVLCPLLTMDNLIVCQLLGILCIVALILVFIIQGFLGVCIRVTLGCQSGCIRVCPCINILLFIPAVWAVLFRTVSCRVMVEDRVVLTVGIQVQSIPVISVFLGKSGNDRVIISCP